MIFILQLLLLFFFFFLVICGLYSKFFETSISCRQQIIENSSYCFKRAVKGTHLSFSDTCHLWLFSQNAMHPLKVEEICLLTFRFVPLRYFSIARGVCKTWNKIAFREFEFQLEKYLLRSSSINIWDEADEGNIIFEDNKLKRVSINKMVNWIFVETHQPHEYTEKILNFVASVMKPSEFVCKLMEKYFFTFSNKAKSEGPPADFERIQILVVQTLKKFAMEHLPQLELFDDEETCDTMAHLLLLFFSSIEQDAAFTTKKCIAIQAKQELISNLRQIQQEKSATTTTTIPSQGCENEFWDYSDKEIAQQITLFQYNLAAKIKPYHFIAHTMTTSKTRQNVRVIEKMLQANSRLCIFFVQSILKIPTVKARANLMARLISICIVRT